MNHSRFILFILFILSSVKLFSEDKLEYPLSIYELYRYDVHPIDDAVVEENYYQIANEINVDYYNTLIKWYITDKFKIGENTYFILYKDCYFYRYCYLCSASEKFRYPRMILLCTIGMGGDTPDYFEINAANNTVEVIKRNFIKTISDYPQKDNFRVSYTIYDLSDELKIKSSKIETEDCGVEVYLSVFSKEAL